MKKILWTLAVAVAMISSCDLNIDTPDKPKDVDPTAVGFNVYVNRGLQTKAGWAGVLTTDDLKDVTKANGFGVFAYYGNGALYNETSKPDFMYDQQVAYRTDYNVWDYTPIKYWPNEFGEAASSEGADRLTFFAYAPYADVTPSTGVVTDGSTTGIIGMSRNVAAGDPVVMYSSSLKPGSGVDLCWGVAASDFKSSVDGQSNDVKAGYPFVNVVKTKTGDRLQFSFHHALAQLNVQIDADINNDVSGADGKTKIYVRSVTFNGFSMRGSLNLNSNVADGPIWYDVSGTGRLRREPVTVYDGRTDGMEGVATAKDASEKPSDLNLIIVQSKPYGDAELSAGVTTTAVNLFNNTEADAPVMVIPTPGVPLSVTIVYDIETEDKRLAGYLSDGVTHGSSVENKITKTIKLTESDDLILSSGKKYVVNLHLGLTSVKFDADVAVWDNTTYPNPIDVNLPDNSSVTPPTPTMASFRGYGVSKGILERTVVSSEASYSLTTGDNQFEILGYYGVDENKGKYYHQWTKLKEELGSDADGNIKASSNKLPDGWTMPGSAEWEEIVFGDATGITINGQTVTYGYALVSVTVGTQIVPSLLLVPDNTAIELASLDGSEVFFDEEDGDYGYEEINLSSSDYTYLMGKDCRFLPISGCFDNVVNHAWKHGMEDFYPEGYYWGYDHHQMSQDQAYFLWVNYDDEWAEIRTITALSDYYPVRLVKKIN